LYSTVNIVDLIDEGYVWAGKRIAAVQPSELTAPTPCDAWNLRQLLNHMLGALSLHLDAANGLPVAPSQFGPDIDRVGADPVQALGEVAARAARMWREPGVLDRTAVLPMGPVPGSVLALLHLTEVLVHGWDVGRAIGENVVIPAELAEPALEFSRGFATDAHRGTAFAAELPTGDKPGERLVAFLGRRP
jgi:uncharacterized protein (TIGR03086 family)